MRSVPDQIAAAVDALDPKLADTRERGLQGGQIGVEVANHCDAFSGGIHCCLVHAISPITLAQINVGLSGSQTSTVSAVASPTIAIGRPF
jgi:hypothetical protein